MLRFLVTLLVPFGRAPRWQFWFVLILACILALPVIGIPLQMAQVPVPEFIGSINNIIPIFVGGIMALVAVYLLFVAFATRLHDRGRTGFWVFLMLLPLAAAAGLLWVQANPTAVPFPIPPEALLQIDLVNKVLAGLAGLLFAWLLLASMFFPGTQGPNWFGRDPSGDKAPQSA